MKNKYGLYIKGRGWIKTVDLDKGIKCCRNFADVYANFRFDNKNDVHGLKYRYSIYLDNVKYEIREVFDDDIVDKRVIPSKRYKYEQSYYSKPFVINAKASSTFYLRTYCTWCGLRMLEDEESSSGVCIHCLVAFTKLINKRYIKMDTSIKEAWERATIMDEI